MKTPILLLGYNRPEKFRNLITSISCVQPREVLIAIDGPKKNQIDQLRVAEVHNAIGTINWKCNIDLLIRDSNLGLKRAVTEAISWAINKEGRIIVLEDDVIVGPNFIDYCRIALTQYSEEKCIGQVNGWNQVPYLNSSRKELYCQKSIYNTSYAWATWEDRWRMYDETLEWGLNVSLKELSEICGSSRAAWQWKINFRNASDNLVDSWSYRWLATMWSQRWYSLSPSRSLVTYCGYDEGTHTRTSRVRFQNLVDSEFLPLDPVSFTDAKINEYAESWLRKKYFNDSIFGVCRSIIARLVLLAITKFRNTFYNFIIK